MPLFLQKSTLVHQKRKAEVVLKKEPKRAIKAPMKAITTTTHEEGDPKSQMKGRVAKVGASSLSPKIYKQLTLHAMVPGMEHFAKPRKHGLIERSQVEVPEVLCKRWSRSLVRDVELFQPKLKVLDDESLLLDCPLEGGNMGYQILKGIQLKYDMPVDGYNILFKSTISVF